jgi:hypothetical protein
LLNKSLYSVQQAPRHWKNTITTRQEEYGFIQSKVDPCIYVFCKAGELYVLALYVDDTNIAGSSGNFIVEVKKALGRRFNVQDMGPVSWLLGMTVERDRGNKTLKIGQGQCIWDMLGARRRRIAGGPEGGALAGPSAPTSTSTLWAHVTM